MNFDDEQAVHESRRAADRRARDFDDLQNELAGNETGRVARFLPPEAAGGNAAEKRRTERAEAHTRLQLLLMSNPEYASLYKETGNRLRETQNELDRMRERAQKLLEDEREAIDRIDARAARDTEGRPMFRDQNGAVRYADGAPVPDDKADAIVWRGDEPGFEERSGHAERYERIGNLITDIDTGQAEIGEIQERLDDSEDPASADDLRAMQERANDVGAGIEERLEGMSQETPQAIVTPSASLAGVSVPKLT